MGKMSAEQLSKSYNEVNAVFKKFVNRVAEIRTKDQFLNAPILRVFISVPMNGRTEEAIMADIEEAKAAFNKFFGLDFDGDEVTFIHTFTPFLQEKTPDECRNDRVWYLGNSIKILSTCDIILFAKNSYRANGCNVEDHISDSYGIPSIRIDEKRKGDTRAFDYINGHLTLFVLEKEEPKPKCMTDETCRKFEKAVNDYNNELMTEIKNGGIQ